MRCGPCALSEGASLCSNGIMRRSVTPKVSRTLRFAMRGASFFLGKTSPPQPSITKEQHLSRLDRLVHDYWDLSVSMMGGYAYNDDANVALDGLRVPILIGGIGVVLGTAFNCQERSLRNFYVALFC